MVVEPELILDVKYDRNYALQELLNGLELLHLEYLDYPVGYLLQLQVKHLVWAVHYDFG